MRRLTLALVSGDNPRLTLEMYFAVTSNTAQFGARLELYAAAWKFNAYGFLSFDVLFQFNPFYFIADVSAMLALRVGSSSIASIDLNLTLEGPTPWKAKGDAKLKLCWFLTVKIRFNKTFGETRNTALPDLLVLPLVKQALEARDNWVEQKPPDRHRLESLRELPVGASEPVRVHPVGIVAISQKVVPLDIAIERIGAQRPADARTFSIAAVTVNGEAQGAPPQAEESFAPAQFFDMSDADKLAEPLVQELRERDPRRGCEPDARRLRRRARSEIRDQVHRLGARAAPCRSALTRPRSTWTCMRSRRGRSRAPLPDRSSRSPGAGSQRARRRRWPRTRRSSRSCTRTRWRCSTAVV